MTLTLAPLSDHSVRTAADGDNMLHEDQLTPAQRSRGWTTLTRIDTRVGPGIDDRPVIDPLPAEKFELWESVQYQGFRRRHMIGADQ